MCLAGSTASPGSSPPCAVATASPYPWSDHGTQTHQLEQDPRGRLRPEVADAGGRIQRWQADSISRGLPRSPSTVHGRTLGDELFRGQDRRELLFESNQVGYPSYNNE